MKTITVPDFADRKKLKSKFFYISNSFKNADGVMIYIECKPFSNKKADEVIIFSNSVKIYKNRVPIDEIKNIATYSNSELISIIEDRI